MSARRVLVEGAVLSLRDSCVYYPCCRCCYSRIDVEQGDAARCLKCGYRCLKEQLDYRYRLALKVARDESIFGVTVFGTCLNPFFGIAASGFQRLVDNGDGAVAALTRSTILVQAVEDCFIGRQFIFAIKVTGTEIEPWSRGPVTNGCSSRDTAQFIASHMILPKATERTGCTVLSYYRVLLQRAEEFELRPADSSYSSRPPAKALLLLIPLHSPAGAFNKTLLSASALLPQSLQRSQDQDSSINPTPPWQQSLGLVTSSAEQDESVATQKRVPDYSNTPPQTQRSCAEDHKLTEEQTLSPLLPYLSPFSIYPDLSVEENPVDTPTGDRRLSPPPSFMKDSPLTNLPSVQLTRTFSSTFLAWDDLPFSESLTEFLCEKGNVSQTEHQNVQNVAGTTGHNLENVPDDKKPTAQTTVKQSRLLANVTNTSAPNKRRGSCGLSDGVCEKPEGRVKSSKAKSICPSECYQPDVLLSSLSFEELEGETYNCSADLFSSSVGANTTTLCRQTEAVSADAGGTTNPGKQTLRSELPGGLHLTPNTPKLQTNNMHKLDLPAPYLHFVPPAQSTPNVKLTVAPRLPGSRRFSSALGGFGLQLGRQDPCVYHGILSELACTTRMKTSSPWKLNAVGANPLPLCGGKRKSSVCDVTVGDRENNEVPPTPAARTHLSMKRSRRRLRDNCSSNVASTCGSQKGHKVTCRRSLLSPSLRFVQRSMAQTGNSDDEGTCGESSGGADGYLLDDDNQACDWSRDLFSDS